MTVRILALAVLVAAVAALATVLLGGGERYRVHLRLADAGLLVDGGQVKVAGRDVGTIERIDVTRDGLADVELDLRDDEVVPLHTGTRATVRSLGAATIANRYVDLAPGPDSAPALPDGAVLGLEQTTGIVNLDAVFDMFDPATRADVQELMGRSAELFAGSGAPAFNRMLGKVSPAAQELAATSADLTADETRLARLITTARSTSQVLANRRPDLEQALVTSGRWLRTVADERAALTRTLQSAPGALAQGRRTLRGARGAVVELRPALRRVPAAAAPLEDLLREARPALRDAGPVAEQLRRELPALRSSINGMRPLARRAVPALEAVGGGLEASTPILRGLRIYAPDFVLGIVNGLAGVASANYTKDGHYARLEFIQNPQTTVGGAFAELLTKQPLIPEITGVRTGLDARCAGSNAPPAPDGSNPFIPDASLCDPAQSVPLGVNSPPGSTARLRAAPPRERTSPGRRRTAPGRAAERRALEAASRVLGTRRAGR